MKGVHGWSWLLLVPYLFFFGLPDVMARDLSFDERVGAQRAIEEVYFRHLEGTQRTFDEVMPLQDIQNKVRRYIQESAALEKVWNRPITGAALAAELQRIRSNTKFPDRLDEIFAALDHDPLLIQECFVRPALSQRLAGQMLAREGGAPARGTAMPQLDWSAWVAAQPELAEVDSLPSVADETVPLAPDGLPCPAPDTWDPGSLEAGLFGRTNHSVHWTGTEMLVWGNAADDDSTLGRVGLRYDPVADTWTPMSDVGAPPQFQNHVAVWSGSELIVWTAAGVGGRYNPLADTWLPVSAVNAPAVQAPSTNAPYNHAVWAGGRMVVWGSGPGAGRRYDPTTDTWSNMSAAGDPGWLSGRSFVSTGTEMIVWGGDMVPFYFNTGARYNPTTDTWTSLSVPTGNQRSRHSAVWTGTKMIIWGGQTVRGTGGSFPINTGLSYDLATDSWAELPTAGAPFGRTDPKAVVVGNKMMVWGSAQGSGSTTGGLLDLTTEQWLSATSVIDAPQGSALDGRMISTGAAADAQAIVWGGVDTFDGLAAGSRYDPVTDTWHGNSASGVKPSFGHLTVWTGTEVLVWKSGTGNLYDPLLDSWRSMSTVGAPNSAGTASCSSAWTGEELVLLCTGTGAVRARYRLATDTWASVSAVGAPASTVGGMVWTGQRVFALCSGSVRGRLYDPFLDRWSYVSTVNQGPDLPPVGSPALVWTGSQVLEWQFLVAQGALYDPATDTWAPMSTSGAPSKRQSAAMRTWTGEELIVVGGFPPSGSGPPLTDGYRYNLGTNAWAPISMVGAHWSASTWTGSRALTWGADALNSNLTAASMYDPVSNSWSDMETTGDPRNRTGHSLIWIDRFLFVWGGKTSGIPNPNLTLGTGSRYFIDKDGDGLVDSCDNCPLDSNASQLDADDDGTGDACDVCPAAPDVDFDHDGYVACLDCDDTRYFVRPGAPEVCDGLNNDCNAPGWPSAAATPDSDNDGDGARPCTTDCDDTNANSYVGAPEICDAADNDCDAIVDEDAAGVDTDMDTVRNACDNCVGTYNSSQGNADGDGLGDACDNCPLDALASQADADGDFAGDACDNCPEHNQIQSDVDSDGEGDACDEDDGLIWIAFYGPGTTEWDGEAGFTRWNAYRGDLAVLRSTGEYTQVPGSNALAARDCGLTDPSTAEPGDPAAGSVAFWLVTGVTGSVESDLGEDSSGIPRPNANPCF